ncbi:MAG: rRNA maturation RNase YbeY [Gammaproteobacteria bacterium]|nr:rRNA maturation RNase YbeY [Gammaproteobacteria bacterium]
MGLEFELQLACEVNNLPSEAEFRLWLLAGLQATQTEQAELSMRIVSADESQRLNAEYRGKEKPTNVLSFPWQSDFPELEGEADYLGDLALCAEVVQREAAEQNKAERAHWAHLSVHGLLHLLGFDHQEAQQAQEMEALEISILSQLHYPNPYEAS